MNKLSKVIVLSAISNSYAAEIPRFIDRPFIVDTNLMCMDDRCYSLLLGQFISQDYDKQNYSLYGYSKANPIKYSDKTGDKANDLGEVIEETFAFVGAVVLTVATDGAASELDVAVITDITETSATETAEGIVSSADGTLVDALTSTSSTVEKGAQNAPIQEFITPNSSEDFKAAEQSINMDLDSVDDDSGIEDNQGDFDDEGDDDTYYDAADSSSSKQPNDNFSQPEPDDPVSDSKSEDGNKIEDDKSSSDDSGKQGKKDEPPLTLKQKVMNIIKGPGKEVATLAAFIGAPPIIAEMKPSPTPPPKPPKPPK